ncbi:toprim domain-containing protein [Petrimonas sp.]|uniref:toprim domain-containing protein n=1 Tax=Petrimonas sp. TaxID=2023866 RepID=UPI003F5111C4
MKTSIEILKQKSIKRYLAENGIYPAREYSGYGIYKSPFRNERKASFKVDYHKNLWRDFGSDEGGSIIDLVMKMKQCSFIQAVRHLEEKADFPVNVKTAFSPSTESVGRMKLVKVNQLLPPHLEKYIRDRCIPSDLTKEYLTAVYYDVNGREYSALGFKNDKGGFELRNRDFQGCYPPKTITTFDHTTTTCNLFEGFTDFLSYLTLYPMKEKNLSPESTVVLNSTGNLEKALPFLSKHTRIYAYLDNDEGGKSATQKLKKSGFPVIDCSHLYANDKDLNDFLKRMIRQKPAQNINKSKRIKF